MRCSYIKEIELPGDTVAIEWNWAKATRLIEKIYMIDKLGIDICPGGDHYFSV